MKVQLKQINDVKVRPVKLPVIEKEKIKGRELFEEIYSNIAIIARKKQGKTSVIFKIIKSCVNKNSTVLIFCSTHNKDKVWIEIKKYLGRKNINFLAYDSIYDNGQNHISELIKMWKKQEENINNDEKDEIKNIRVINTGSESDDEKEYVYRPKKICPKYVIIFDDLGTEISSKEVGQLLMTNRHWLSRVILSTQYPNSLAPAARKQLDYWILFGKHAKDKLELIFKDSDLSIDFDLFFKLYKNATEQRFNFLYIDTINSMFRKNFNQSYLIEE